MPLDTPDGSTPVSPSDTSPSTIQNEGQPQGGTQPYVQSQQGSPITPAGQEQQPQQSQPGDQQQTVSNADADRPTFGPNGAAGGNPDANHPSVQRAGWIYKTAQALAGGPRYRETIDANTGQTTREQVPLSRADIVMAIAMEAITGAISGLAQTSPGPAGRAPAAGFQQVAQERRQADANQNAIAQQNYENQSKALTRKASIAETNSRTILNTATAEQMGAEAIDKLVALNRASGVLDAEPEALDNNGEPMTQDDLLAAMKSGKLNVTDQLGLVVGRVEVPNADGSKRWEATHVIVKDPNTKVPLTQETWNRFADAGVPGFPKGTNIGSTAMIPLRMLQNANEVAGSHALANARLTDLKWELDGTPFADHARLKSISQSPVFRELS